MSKRKAEEMSSLLGIAAYGSDDEETDNEGDDDGSGHVNLLLGYHHEEEEDDEHDQGGANMEEDGEGEGRLSPSERRGEESTDEAAGATPSRRVVDSSAVGTNGTEGGAEGEASAGPVHETDPDYLILPPELREPPPGQPPIELVSRIEKIFKAREQGRLLSKELKGSREYQNPDFLNKIVDHFVINERGSCFRKEVFDPQGLPPEDHIKALRKEWQQLEVRKAKERAERKAIDFEKGGVQSAPAMHPAHHTSAAQAIAQAQLKASVLSKPKTKWDLGK